MKYEKAISTLLQALESSEEPSKQQLIEIAELNKRIREKHIDVLGRSNVRELLWDGTYGKPIRQLTELKNGDWVAFNPNAEGLSAKLKQELKKKQMYQIGQKGVALVFFNSRLMISGLGTFNKEMFCVVINPNNEEIVEETEEDK